MSISFTTNFPAVTNLVLPLAQNNSGLSVRVVSQGSGTLGTLTASGLQNPATWTLNGSVPTWISSSVDSTGTILSLIFTGAQYQQDPYEFFVTCTDGVNSSYFPVYMEVRSPFVIAANTTNPVVVSGSTLNVPSFDSTVSDILIQGFGLFNSQQGNCNFILPSALPAGLNFVTSNEGQLKLRVSEPHFGNAPFSTTDLVGGLQLYASSPIAVPFTVQAYQPGSFYDEADRSYTLTLSVGSQSQKAGVLNFGAGAYYDTGDSVLSIDAEIDVLLGTLQSQGVQVPQPLKYQWTTSGSYGSPPANILTPNSGGNISGATNNKFATYTINGTGAASVSIQVTDGNGLPILNGLKTINFNQIAQSGTSWLSTDAIKIGVAAVAPATGSDKIFGSFGSTLTLTLSSADGFNAAETLYFTLNTEAESSIEAALPNPVITNTGLTIDSGTPTTTVSFQFPAGAAIGNKWVLKIAAANASVSPTRTGYAQILFECTGNPPLTIGGTTSTISSSTGTNITPIQLSATDPSSNPVTSAQFELVGGSEFGAGVLGAPDGVFIDNLNRISGNATTPGTYKFVVAASATGFIRSYSQVITMTVTQVAIPLQITNPTTSASSIPDNTTFNISWGISGNPSALYLAQIPGATPIRTVTGAGSASTSQVGSSVYSVYGTSYYGTAYSVPLVVISSSIAAAQSLLPAPTIATIDENYNLTANWQPYQVSGSYAAYKGWNISLASPPTGTPVVVFTDGLENGGTASARVFEEALTSGDFSMNMTALSSNFTVALDSNPWDTNHTFPTSLQASNVTLDNTNILLGQTLTITLNANYAGASAWQVSFPDNTSTGWLPLSTRSVAKSFNTPGAQNIIIQTQNDFGTANPPVKLRRQLTQQIYVVDQQFNPAAAAQGALTGTLGIGGEAGFEITDASTGTVTPQPYEVVIRSIARDTITNELKLMIATSRFSNASSLLSTMAIDVFPMMGRPHAKELITPVYILETNANTSAIPVNITTTTLPSNSYVGKPMQEFKMQATGGLTNYSWYSEGLPPGLKMNIDGTISGTPTQLGAFTVNFAVMDSSSPAYIAETTITFTIPTDLAISTTSLPAATVGLSYENYTNPSNPQPLVVQNTGGLAPYTWAIVAGQVPIGISIDPSSGTMGGVPCTYNSTTDFTKSFTFTVQVTDAIGAKASQNYTIALNPATLQYGVLNQPTIVAGEQFKLTVPVFGGQSPYTLTSFTDNGVVGTGLSIVNPTEVAVVAGVTPATLTVINTDTTFYPQSYPNNIALTLGATGGVPSSAGLNTAQSYKFYVDPTANNTLPGAVCYGPLLVASPTADGTYQVTIKVIDTVGHIGSKLLNITTQQQGAGEYTIAPYKFIGGSPTNPLNYVALPSGFPDPVASTPYTPGAGQYYCMVLLDNGTLKLSNGATPAVVDILNGALPAGLTTVTGNSLFSTTGVDCAVFIEGTPSANGSSSFELQISGILNPSNATVSCAQRFGLKVGGGGVASPVVAILFEDTLDLDLNTLVPDAIGSYSWAYPLIAEGGTSPYAFTVQSGTTLPGITTGVAISSLPAFASATTAVNTGTSHYDVILIATDKNGVQSASVDIPVKIVQSTTQAIHILSNTIPAYVYVNRALPANTYYVESDLVANWTATGLPAGITLSSAPGNRVYLQGTPTQTSSGSNITFTATSATFGTTANVTVSLVIKAQAAVITAPSHFGATAVIGTQYRVVNNNAIITAQYTGFQPGDASLPLLQNTLGSAQIGAPGLSIGGQPTTGNSNVTADGFTMAYDYLPTGPGSDTLTFNNVAFPDSLVITEVYPSLSAAGSTVPYSVSEYTVTQTMAAPVTISGGAPPYSINITGVSDSRFTTVNNGTANAKLQITISQFAASTTPYNCNVSMTISDSASNTINVTGQLQVTIVAQTFITVAFSDYTWNISASSPPEPQLGSIVMNSLMSTPQLGHAPYSYYVDSVTLPGGLGTFVQNSPSKRVLAFNLNETNTTASVADVNQTLTPSGTYNVTATNLASAPTVGTYAIAVALRVVDSKGIIATSTQHVNVVISS